MGRRKETDAMDPHGDADPIALLRVESRDEMVEISADQKVARLAAAVAIMNEAVELDMRVASLKDDLKEAKQRAEAKHAEAEAVVRDANDGKMRQEYPIIVEPHPTHPAEIIEWRVPDGVVAADILNITVVPAEGQSLLDAHIAAREAQGCVQIQIRAMTAAELDAVDKARQIPLGIETAPQPRAADEGGDEQVAAQESAPPTWRIAIGPDGPWLGNFAAAPGGQLYDVAGFTPVDHPEGAPVEPTDRNGETVGLLLSNNSGEAPWYILHPDGRREHVNCDGEHVAFLDPVDDAKNGGEEPAEDDEKAQEEGGDEGDDNAPEPVAPVKADPPPVVPAVGSTFDRVASLIAGLKHGQTMSKAEIAKYLEKHPDDVDKALKKLRDDGKAVVVGKKRGARWGRSEAASATFSA